MNNVKNISILVLLIFVNCDKRIWNGVKVLDNKKYAYVARITQWQFKLTDSKMMVRNRICTAVHIRKFWFVTAKHCLVPFWPNHKICLGLTAVDTQSSYGPTCLSESNIDKILPYPQTFDISMFNVSKPFPVIFPESVMYAPLIQPAKKKSNEFLNKYCQIAGWGIIGEPDDRSIYLMETTMKIMWLGKVSRLYTCHSFTTGGCQGDSGGPLVCDGLVIGILSAGDNKFCKHDPEGRYTYFLAVEYFLDFINDPEDFLRKSSSGYGIKTNILLLLIQIILFL